MVSAWRKNNRRELRKTMGRFLAMVSIVALGVSILIGLQAARPAMVKTCNLYLNNTSFYDLQLVSSIAFDRDAPDVFSSVAQVRSAEGSISSDLLAAMDDSELVFKTHMLLPSINQVHLTAGRLPEAPHEVLADDLYVFPEDLGKEITVIHQEDSVFAYDSYTIVGLCNSPQYLNMSRGTSTLGDGTVRGFLFLQEQGYDTDYWTEIFIRLEGDHDAFSDDYLDNLALWENPMLEILQEQGKSRTDRILKEARQELNKGWAQYHSGLEEYEAAKAEAEAELEDARLQLEDAEKQLEEGRKELEQGEAALMLMQINPYLLPELADAKEQLQDAERQLELGEMQYQTSLAQYESMKGPLEGIIQSTSGALATAESTLEYIQQTYYEAEEAWRLAEAAVRQQSEQLYGPIAQLEQTLSASQATLASMEATLAELQSIGASATEIALAEMAVQLARSEVNAVQSAYDFAITTYETQLSTLNAQLDAATQTLNTTGAMLTQTRDMVSGLSETLRDAEDQLADAETQLEDAQMQLQDGRAQLEAGEAALEQGAASAVYTAEQQLEEGRKALAEGEQQYQDGLKEYNEGKAQADKEFAKAEKELNKALRELREAELELQRMKDPSYYVLTPSSNGGYLSFDNDTSIVAAIANVFPVFFLLIAALVCSSTMSRMVEEQRIQNGTLKAMGYSNGKIMFRYASYAGYAALIGAVIGLILGNYLFPFVIWEAYKMLYHFGELEYLFSWGMAAIAISAALLCCCGSACAAAWNDLLLMPAQLMRPKAPKAGKRIFLERIPFLWNHLSFLAKVSLRNIFRYKKRLFMMLLGTGGCLALLLAGLGLRDSIVNVVGDQFGSITMYDYLVTFEEHQTKAEQDAFAEELDDTAEHCIFISNSALDVPSKVGIKSVSIVACSDPAIDDILGLYWNDTDLGYPTGDGLYISHALAEDAGLQVGDKLPIQLESKAMLEIPITGIFTNYVSHYAFLTEEGYKTWFGIEPEMQSAYVTAAEGEDLYAVNALLQSSEGVLNVTMTQDMKAMVSDAISSMNAIIVLIVVCAAALAFVVGYNLININITERVREIATIKVLGFYKKETYSYVFREAILLTIMGTIVGVPLGIWLNRFIMSVVKVDFVRFQAQISPKSFALGVALTLLVTIVVDKMLGKKIDRINMAESLKSVE